MYNIREILRRGLWEALKLVPYIIVVWGLMSAFRENFLMGLMFPGLMVLSSMMSGALYYLDDLGMVYISRKSISIFWALVSITASIGLTILSIFTDLIAPHFINFNPMFIAWYPESTLMMNFVWMFSLLLFVGNYARFVGYIAFQVNIVIGLLISLPSYIVPVLLVLVHRANPNPAIPTLIFLAGAILFAIIHYIIIRRRDLRIDNPLALLLRD
ncbi:MAG: hypothetical protein COA82_02570 [Alkaliphilus sp.]|nr:hypothetical protein [bacterium AH-315-L21]MBN4069331.1 hypothetical protein [bacterium AH-315-G05]PHS35925.1 MAG: hypothetical protein COA82_02570 [Alkaliphilus sp.]